MRVVTTLFLMAISLSCLACVVSPTPAAPTPDIPATVEAIVREALSTPEPTRTPVPSPTPSPRATVAPVRSPQIVIPTLAPTELLREPGILRYIATPIPRPTLPEWTIPTPWPIPPIVIPPLPTITVPLVVTPTPKLPLATIASTERPQATPRVTRRMATPVPPTATPTALPTVAPTLVPLETASKVARTVNTSLGQRVDITVEGFAENRLLFNQLVQVINDEEQLLGVPFPAPRVSMRRVRDLPGGFCGHNQMSYESRYRGDPYIVEASVIRLRVDSKCDDTFGSLAHEAAHTWFHGSDAADWIDEGLANSIEYQIKEANPETAEKYPPVTYCASYRNISELESAVPIRDASTEASGFSCNYRLGDGIFGALRQHFGADEFNRRIAKLARRSENRTNRSYTVTDVREALGADEKSQRIIGLWYDGEPDMRIYRHLDQVTFTHPPTLDGDYLHFAGRTQAPGMVFDFVIGKDPYCSQFHLYSGLADPDYLGSITDPPPVGWHHTSIPKLVVINSEVNSATGDFQVTARVNDLTPLKAKNLSLQIGSRTVVGVNQKCEEDTHFSQVKIVPGPIKEELKKVRHYHQETVLWAQPPRVKDFSLTLAGVAPPGTLSFEWKERSCSQVLLYEFDARGYTYVATVYPMLPAGRSWNTIPDAEVASGKVYSDGRFEAIIEIWDKSLLSHDHLVLVVRVETRENDTNTCLTEEVMGAARIN